MSLRKVFVNRSIVVSNRDTGQIEPVFVVLDQYGNEHHGSDIILIGPSALRYDPNGSDGQRIWIETWDKVILKNDIGSVCPSMEAI